MSFASVMSGLAPTVWCRLDDGSGAAAFADSSGNGHNLTVTGSVATAASLLAADNDAAESFNGSQFGEAVYSSWMGATTALSVWHRVTPAATSGYYSLWDRDKGQAGNHCYQDRIGAGKYSAILWIGGTLYQVAGATTLVAGNTYSLGFTYDGAHLTLYVDGIQDGQVAVSGAPDNSSNTPLVLGANSSAGGIGGAQRFQGVLDEAALWIDTALSAADHLALHNAAVTPPHGTASGALNLAGTAHGGQVHAGTATGTLHFAGVAHGVLGSSGTGSGQLRLTGSAHGSARLVAHGTATGLLGIAGSASGTTPPVRFRPPTIEVSHRRTPFIQFYYHLTQGLSVIRIAGHYQTVHGLSQNTIDQLVDGVDYFVGGYEYVVDAETANALAADGYTANMI